MLSRKDTTFLSCKKRRFYPYYFGTAVVKKQSWRSEETKGNYDARAYYIL